MGMTNAAFLNKKYHKLFWEESKLLALVHAHHNCEDIGMNFVIEKELRRLRKEAGDDPEPSSRKLGTNVYLFPPTRMYINQNHVKQSALLGHSPIPTDKEFDEARLKRWKHGISTNQTGHAGTRDLCIQEFRRIFGFHPQVRTPYTITWHPACFPGMTGHCHDALLDEVRMDYSTFKWLSPAGDEPGIWKPIEGASEKYYLRISMDDQYNELDNPKLQARPP